MHVEAPRCQCHYCLEADKEQKESTSSLRPRLSPFAFLPVEKQQGAGESPRARGCASSMINDLRTLAESTFSSPNRVSAFNRAREKSRRVSVLLRR